MQLRPADRAEKVKIIPAADRALVEDRLKQWDQVPAPAQKELLENQLTIHYILRLESSPAGQREDLMNPLPAGYRKALEEKLEQWNALPPERRHRMSDNFQQFFALPVKEKVRTLDVLSEEERKLMEKSLDSFNRLPRDQRAMILSSIQKFAEMSKS